NPLITDEEREKGRFLYGSKLVDWRVSVFERDNYSCQVCFKRGSTNLNAHHLNSYNWDKGNRLNLENGVTLCDKCHKSFHNEYGYGDNTKEQFFKFLNSEGKQHA